MLSIPKECQLISTDPAIYFNGSVSQVAQVLLSSSGIVSRLDHVLYSILATMSVN
jgi:hypothetical protein